MATGTEDHLHPPSRIARPARALLGTDVVAVPGLGHLGPHEGPTLLSALLSRLRS
ncbi:hypothetical protein AB0K12_20490 [Nonomuraea sp. NPDC049419]|uniref:hypothetical protein n=1 Tax=Nonomuraea sp. NPDC049419 TaxID=3155772 RepID=UPI003440E7EA